MIWRRLRLLWPSHRRTEEREMREELDALAELAPAAELGNLTLAAENARQTWHWTAFDGVFADVRYAGRTLRRDRAFVAVAVISLGLAIGANVAVFGLADAILLRPLPVTRASEVLSVAGTTAENPMDGLSYPEYEHLRRTLTSFSGVVAYRSTQMGVATASGETPQIRLGMMVSRNFFDVLGIAPSLGRTFLPAEGNVPGRDRIAILGFDFWNAQYGADPAAVGRTFRLNGIDFTIAGIAPRSFPGMELLYRPSVFVPLSMWSEMAEGPNPLEDRGRRELTVRARLARGASRQTARSELATAARNLESTYPDTNRNRGLAVRTELETRIQQGPMRLGAVTMLVVLGALVLVIACANVAGLLLARARSRAREIAVRLAIGAGRLRLVRQLMVESLAIALLGGVAGLTVAAWGMRFLAELQVSSEIPLVLGLEIDGRVLLFTLAATLASCLLFGLAPALQASRRALMPALRASGEPASARRRTSGRNVLVGAQIALSMVLLIVAGTFLDGFGRMVGTSPGFRYDHRISMGIDTLAVRYSEPETLNLYRQLSDRIRAIPGVRSVALAETLPFAPDQASVTVVPEGAQLPEGRESVSVYGGAVDESYFDTMKVPIVRGRPFRSADRSGSQRVAIVNQEFAKTYWPNQDAIGKRLRLSNAVAEVVGVARTGPYLFPTEPPRPYVYLAHEQTPRSRMTLIAETAGDPSTLAPLLREAVRASDADLPILNLRTLESHVSRARSNWVIFLQVFLIMGLVGLAVAMAGLYGVISFSVSRRTAEIGVRMAIGADRAGVVRLILRQGLALAAAGMFAGGALAAFIAPALAAGSVGPGTRTTIVYCGVSLILLAVSAAACYAPARRASKLDPIRALRCD